MMPKDESKIRLPQRRHSRRTCTMCKKMKTRCELPNIEVSASEEDPLPPDLSCHRCSTLKIPCIVSTPLKPLSTRSLKRIAKMEAAEKEKEKEKKEGGSASAPAGSSSLSDHQSSSTSSDSQAASTSAIGSDARPSVIHSWAPTGNNNDSLESRLREEAAEKLLFNPLPLAILNDLVSRQRMFGSSVSKAGSDRLSMSSICKVLSPHEASMEQELLSMLPWIPHLPSISTLRREFQENPDQSNRLLLSSIYSMTLPRSFSSRSDVVASLREIIKENLLPLLVSSSPSIRTVQALQFVSVYTPITVLSLDPDTSQPLLTGSLTHSAAVRTAKLLGLDRCLEQLISLSSIVSISDEEHLSQLAESAVVWMSLCSWGLHFQALDRTDDPFLAYSSNSEILDWKSTCALLSPFFQISTSSKEAHLRMAGCIASSYRRESLRLYLETKVRLISAGQIRQVRDRADELTRVLNSYQTLTVNIRQTCEDDFASLGPESSDSISNWCSMEARCLESLLTCSATARGTLECAMDFSHFYERMKALDIVAFVGLIGGNRRTAESMEVIRSLIKVGPSDQLRPPPRSTCGIGLFSSLHMMENLRLCIYTFGRKSKDHDEIVSLLDQGSSHFGTMDSGSDSDSNSGNLCQATSNMFNDMLRVIRGWEKSFAESGETRSARQLENQGYFEEEARKQEMICRQQQQEQAQRNQQQHQHPQQNEQAHHQQSQQHVQDRQEQGEDDYQFQQQPIFQDLAMIPPNPFPSFNSLANPQLNLTDLPPLDENYTSVDWWPFGNLGL